MHTNEVCTTSFLSGANFIIHTMLLLCITLLFIFDVYYLYFINVEMLKLCNLDNLCRLLQVGTMQCFQKNVKNNLILIEFLKKSV